MTGQPYDDDDAEFDAFLQGKGPLAQGLAELKQPEPSAALDAAILAQVAADLERCATTAPGVAAGASAANDDNGPADFRPYRWRERWRMPLALAAGITAISIALPLWQDEVAYQQQAVNTQMQDIQIPAMPAAEPVAGMAAPAPAKDAAAPAAAQHPAAPMAGQAQAEAARRDAAAEKRKADSDDMVRKAMERERAEEHKLITQKRAQQATPQVDAAPLREHASGMAAAPAAPPAPPPPPQAPVPAPSARLSVPATVAPGVPSFDAPAPVVTKPVPVHRLADEADNQPLYPPAMLARIEQLLKEGKRDEALAEWERLRTAYPDYPVPEKLRDALRR